MTTRRLRIAELLSIGSELTVGDTRDTNAGELARSLTEAGVTVGRLTALPDRLDTVAEAFASGLARADLVVSTGGLGPTPDDLTREAIARVCGEEPHVDPDLEAWLRELWSRRGMDFPGSNLKQAWLLPSASALPNPNGTAPGWFVDRPEGGVIVALPGPPREMRPMWHDHALPRLRERGLGADVAARTYRLMGIGESQVAEELGEALLRTANPEVATYARVEAVDVRVSAVGGPTQDGEMRSATDWLAPAAAIVEDRLAAHIWATGTTTWAEAIGARLAELGWRVGVSEVGTGGQVGALFGDVDWLARVESRGRHVAASDEEDILEAAERARADAGADVGLAVRTRERGGDTAVTVGVVTPLGTHRERRMAFLGGHNGRIRAALVAASVLFVVLRDTDPDGTP